MANAAAHLPYRAAVDKNGDIWTGGMHSDRAAFAFGENNRSCVPSFQVSLSRQQP
jgi:hypothetical protein